MERRDYFVRERGEEKEEQKKGSMNYVGHLSKSDPLYEYLSCEIMPKTGGGGGEGFRVFANSSSHTVYIYEDRESGRRVVGKFFAAGERDREKAKRKMYREYNNIEEFRRYLGPEHYAARALGCREDLDCLLVTEFCYGEALDSVIMRAINCGERELLFRKLTAMGYFLATVHNHSARPVMVDFHRVADYFDNIIFQLRERLSSREEKFFRRCSANCRKNPLFYQDQEVLVHGDATPANFLFGSRNYVITFDLERMQKSDRMFDTGRLAGELKHFFLRYTGNKYAAEPFIGHFLWEYAAVFPDQYRAFVSITARLPFYMAMTLLRIARNSYLPEEYRQSLISEAVLTLDQPFSK